MADPSKYNLAEAASEDGTINFYTLLNEDSSADAETLRAKIQAIYAEAQANRDHRNLNRRREYQTLLELLPAARTVLLDPPKRQRYDEFIAGKQAGTVDGDFESFMNDLMGLNEEMEEKTGLLGVQDNPEVRARVIKAPPQATRKRPTPPPAPTPAGPPKGIIGGVGGALIGGIIGYVIFKDAIPALLLAVLAGAIGFVVLNRQSPRPVGR